MEDKYQITKIGDQFSAQKKGWGIALSELLGTWNNVKEDTKIIKTIKIESEDEKIFMTVTCAGADGPIEWKKKQCQIYFENVASNIISGLTVYYDFGFMENQICFNVKKGVLVIQLFSKFKDNSPRQDYFEREFFTK